MTAGAVRFRDHAIALAFTLFQNRSRRAINLMMREYRDGKKLPNGLTVYAPDDNDINEVAEMMFTAYELGLEHGAKKKPTKK